MAEESRPVEIIEAPIPEPETVEPPSEDDGWEFRSFSSKKKGKTVRQESLGVIEEPEAEPEVSVATAEDDSEWWPSTKSKKGKKNRQKFLDPIEEPKADPIPEPEPVTEYTWGWRVVTEKNKENKEEVPEMSLMEDPSAAKEPSAEVLEVPPVPKPVEHSAIATSLLQATPTETSPRGVQSPAPRSGQTVVFTIQFTDEIDTKPLQAMTTLENNTLAAILNAVNSYIDSQSTSLGRHDMRMLTIKSGARKNRDVDLSSLEETMWPEYLEYFRQYTKLPELTVACSSITKV